MTTMTWNDLSDKQRELANLIGIHFDPELAGEGSGWEIPMEPEPDYYETFDEAVIAFVQMLMKEIDRLDHQHRDVPAQGETPRLCPNCKSHDPNIRNPLFSDDGERLGWCCADFHKGEAPAAKAEPERCPTCKSDDKMMHRGYSCGHPDCPCAGYVLHECADPWHSGVEKG